ncbi:MAG: hypothetical protein BWZ10_03350 [candidate division BRC1 bacterium ADurb.BinA364]|nr:MAG: hypothetical protein BWZ10_03350 [candidate division BRC1 bacterium ADurb.BinA364]
MSEYITKTSKSGHTYLSKRIGAFGAFRQAQETPVPRRALACSAARESVRFYGTAGDSANRLAIGHPSIYASPPPWSGPCARRGGHPSVPNAISPCQENALPVRRRPRSPIPAASPGRRPGPRPRLASTALCALGCCFASALLARRMESCCATNSPMTTSTWWRKIGAFRACFRRVFIFRGTISGWRARRRTARWRRFRTPWTTQSGDAIRSATT